MRAILAFAPMITRRRGAFVLTVLLSLVALAAGIGLLGLSGWFLTAASLSTLGAAFNLFVPSAGVRGLSFIRILARYGERLTGHDATLRLLSDLRHWLFARLFPLVPLGRRLGRGDLVSRLLADVDALDTMFLVALGPISTAALAVLAVTILLAVLLPGAAPIYALTGFAAVLLVPVALILVARRSGTEAVVAASQLRQVVLDGLDGHQDLVLFEAVAETERSASEAATRLRRARQKLDSLGTVASVAVQLLAAIALVGTLIVGLGALDAGAIDGPLLAGLLLAVIASAEGSTMLVRSATRLASAAAAAERLDAIGRLEPAIVEPDHPAPMQDDGTIAFKAVRFGHDPARPVLADLSFSVRAGECVAIAGPSGAGKSTIAQLATRLVDADAGTVCVNGCDVRTVSTADLRRHVALMTQDAPVFLDTVRANLRIGRPDASDDALWRMLQVVRLDTLVRSLPQGLGTVLGEAGRTLSAGEARRLCLARTLLSPARIVVLDEPTSGLDMDAESAFLAELPALLAGRTAIVITHAEVPASFARRLELRAGRLVG